MIFFSKCTCLKNYFRIPSETIKQFGSRSGPTFCQQTTGIKKENYCNTYTCSRYKKINKNFIEKKCLISRSWTYSHSSSQVKIWSKLLCLLSNFYGFCSLLIIFFTINILLSADQFTAGILLTLIWVLRILYLAYYILLIKSFVQNKRLTTIYPSDFIGDISGNEMQPMIESRDVTIQ